MLGLIDNFNKESFYKNLSNKPFCTNDFENNGVFKKTKKEAINYQYIQYNNDAFVSALVFDVDEPLATLKWDFVNMPRPNIIMKNKANGHAHLYYALEQPVCKTNLAKIKPLNYLSIIETGLRKRLNADRGYTGLMTKNPLNEKWQTIWGNNKAYSLDFLREFVDDNKEINTQDYGIGRNVYLFNSLRKVGYKEVLFFKDTMNYVHYEKTMYLKAVVFNCENFPNNLLSDNELKSIVRSICRWTWRNFSRERFSEIQSRRAKLPRKKLIEFKEGKRDKTAKEIAIEKNISERTVRRYQKESRNDYLNEAKNNRDAAYKLKFELNYSWQEIADTLGKSVSAVRALAYRSKKEINKI